MSSGKNWTISDYNKLEEMANQGFSHKEISKLLGRSVQSIKIKCSRLKIFNKIPISITHPYLLEEWDYDKNSIDPTKISIGSHKKIWWRCSYKHSYKCNMNDKIFKHIKCPICNNKQILIGYNDIATTHPNILNEWDYTKNTILPTEIGSGSGKEIWWKCNLEHSYKQTPRCKIGQNNCCPYCSGNKVWIGFNDLYTTHPELCEELSNKEDGYKYSKGSGQKIKWKCKKCGYNWKSIINDRSRGIGCPQCNKSKGENKVLEILNKYNIKYDYQKTFENCKNDRLLPFDFYLPDYNICIEYQGAWHYIPHWSSNGQENLKSTKKRDNIKRKFCKKEEIKLIEIPYWKMSNIEEILQKKILGA